MTPPELRGDFQDMPLWREGVRRVLESNLRHFDGVIIVPMTLVNPAYVDEILGELRRGGAHVQHVALLASRETLLRRLRSRGEGTRSWGAAHIERCLHGLSRLDPADPADPADHLPTDRLTHEQVVEEVARRAGLVLSPDPLTQGQRRWERLKVQLKSMRVDR